MPKFDYTTTRRVNNCWQTKCRTWCVRFAVECIWRCLVLAKESRTSTHRREHRFHVTIWDRESGCFSGGWAFGNISTVLLMFHHILAASDIVYISKCPEFGVLCTCLSARSRLRSRAHCVQRTQTMGWYHGIFERAFFSFDFGVVCVLRCSPLCLVLSLFSFQSNRARVHVVVCVLLYREICIRFFLLSSGRIGLYIVQRSPIFGCMLCFTLIFFPLYFHLLFLLLFLSFASFFSVYSSWVFFCPATAASCFRLVNFSCLWKIVM